MTRKWPSRWVSVFLLALALAVRSRADTAGSEFFDKQIRPALAERCYACHDAGSKTPRGRLRVDSREALLQGGDSGPAIVVGRPEDSRLYIAMSHRDPELIMPPNKPKLPEAVIANFNRWIREGAVWPGEAAVPAPKAIGFDLGERKRRLPWIWETPRPQILPAVKNPGWPLAVVDFFILDRLEAKGLAPAPPTDRRTWLRRASLAVTGLPPTLEDLRRFLDDASPGAGEREVDRLLASPHYGERWARHWMDLMRYAESRGHEGDYTIANAYQYRDYLIRALNADVPYDQFLKEHLAGDLLDPPRQDPVTGANESVLGTGWAFLGEEVHSPVDIRQDECERVDNKVDVLSKAFLGMTVACARCHDHKFDAVAAKDYYALSGFVLSAHYRQARFESMEQNRQVARELETLRDRYRPRIVAAVADALQPGVDRMADYLMAARQVLIWHSATNEVKPAIIATAAELSLDPDRLRRWVDCLKGAARAEENPIHCFALTISATGPGVSGGLAEFLEKTRSTHGADLPAGARILVNYAEPCFQPWKTDGEAFGSRPVAPGDICYGSDAGHPILRVMSYGAARRDPFWNQLRTAPGNEDDAGSLAATARAGKMVCTPTFTLGEGKLHYLIKGKTRVYAAVASHLMITGPLHADLVKTFAAGSASTPQWVTHDLSAYSGLRVHLEFGPEGDSELEVLMVIESKEKPSGTIGFKAPTPDWTVGSPRRLAEAVQRSFADACERLGKDTIAGLPNPVAQAQLTDWLVQHADLFADPEDLAANEATAGFFSACDQLAAKVRWESRTAPAWFDGTGVDEAVLIRGKPSRPGALAARSLPAAFPGAHPIITTASSGRLELAEQLADPANPLVARVIVNRVWHHLFGRGLVASVDNFGYLGERPSHPELLDHLAYTFVHGGRWSLKQLMKRLLLTQTYAMSSQAADPQAEEVDAANILLHRMPVLRLEAETIRDALLAVSGRLDSTLYGPPIPVYLTEFVIGRGRPEVSGPLDGAGRRSIYTAVRRNFLSPMMLAFDMPTPFSTVGRRNVTNVPAQALVLMNDELFHQQAGVWAERLLRERKESPPAERIGWLFETAFGRLPDTTESEACLAAIAELEHLHGNGGDPKQAWTELCHALLSANDFIYLR